ncbi:MAG TPA: hypothetical protein VM658_12135 [bacterium]|nr:hypothetical protein [bacterium]
MRRKLTLLALVLLSGIASLAAVTYSPVVQVVPGPTLPAEVKCLRSNNNLDLARFDGRLFLAFRTAPTHFAGTKTHLYIVSSADEGKTWDYEAEVFMGSDMREPRLLPLGGKLMFYFFQAGKNPLGFSPRFVFAMERKSEGQWTEPRKVFQPGCILWRAKVRDGKAYTTAYCGGDQEYTGGNAAIEIYLLTTTNGYDFTPVNPAHPVSATGGSETAFEFDADGTLYLTVRNEGGDGKSWGSKVCKASPEDLSTWTCAITPMKYDSPLMFRRGADIYLIARRNIDGAFDKEDRRLPDSVETLYYMARYWWTPKRTALYQLDKQSLTLAPLLDFPTRGDTAFPGLVPVDDNHYLMYNYSSDPEGKDRVWMSGQLHQTFIYSTVISFD